MDILDLADDVIDIAKKIAPLVVPGAGPAIAAAQAVIDLGRKIKPDLLPADQGTLTATLEDLAERVLAHADQTAANLRK